MAVDFPKCSRTDPPGRLRRPAGVRTRSVRGRGCRRPKGYAEGRIQPIGAETSVTALGGGRETTGVDGQSSQIESDNRPILRQPAPTAANGRSAVDRCSRTRS